MVEQLLIETVFWGAVYGLLHTYALYPLVLFAVATCRRQTRPTRPSDEYPTVTLVIAAYNEKEIIEAKLTNCLELNYPREKLDIVVFSDASTDRTDEIVESYADRGIELRRFDGRIGKTACQNRVAAAAESEILVFSDANSIYEPDAITELVRGFAPGVGCVVGELRYTTENGVEGESAYWRYEQLIKRLESDFHSLVTSNGSIYAVRTASYVPQHPKANSDFSEVLSLVENGERVTYVPTAIAREPVGDTDSELGRRIRITTRSWNTITEYRHLLNPFSYPVFSFQLLSHKLLRWLSPVFLLVALLTNGALVVVSANPVYELLFSLQLAFYALAAYGAVAERTSLPSWLYFHVPYYFLVANYGMLAGLLRFLAGENIVTWETERRDTDCR